MRGVAEAAARLDERCRRAEDEYPRLAAPDGTVAVPIGDLRILLNAPSDGQLFARLFAILDRTETSDEGREFRPNSFVSCREVDRLELNDLLSEMRSRAALATEAGTAETPQSGSVHEGAAPTGNAQ